MLDPKLLRSDLDGVAKALARRGFTLDTARLAELEVRRKAVQVEAQELQNERNTKSKSIGKAKAAGDDIRPVIEDLPHLPRSVEYDPDAGKLYWATFDFYRENWNVNPFNPKNNVNYTPERTKLPLWVPTHPVYCDNPFFWSIPHHDNNMPVLQYQQRFVDKLLSYSLDRGNVLYCMDNETSVTAAWGRFWATYIKKKATEAGVTVETTEMWDPWDLDHISHRESFDHPETYSFVDISQNNHQRGQDQWNNGLRQIEKFLNAFSQTNTK